MGDENGGALAEGSLDGVGEHVGSRKIFEVLDDVGVIASNEADIGTKGFASSSDEDHVGFVFEILNFPVASAIFSHTSEIVSRVDQKEGSVFLANLLGFVEIRSVRIH